MNVVIDQSSLWLQRPQSLRRQVISLFPTVLSWSRERILYCQNLPWPRKLMLPIFKSGFHNRLIPFFLSRIR